jgi:hypothetical protein
VEQYLPRNHDPNRKKHSLSEISDRQDLLENQLALDRRAHLDAVMSVHDLLERSLGANRMIEDKLDGALHELRTLNFRLNSLAEPRSPEALFRALQEESLRESLKIIKLEMPSAMYVLDHRSFLRYAMSNAGTGVVIEFGVFSGMTINWMAEDYPERAFFGFDSFKGLPEAWSGHELFDFNRDGAAPEVRSNVELVEGLFAATLPGFIAGRAPTIAALHVDCDIYSSTKTIFDELGEHLRDGCVIIFDEYFNYPGFETHERKAFTEFLEKEKCSVDWIAYSGQRVAGILRR